MTTPCWSLWRAQTTNTILDEIYLPIYIGGNFKHIIFKISDLLNFRGGNSPANGFQFIFPAIWESNLERAEIKSFQWTCRTCEKNVGDFVGAHSRVINSRRDKFVRIFWGCSDRGWGRPRGLNLGEGVCRLEKDVEAKEHKQQLERKNTDDNEIKQKCIFALFYWLSNS